MNFSSDVDLSESIEKQLIQSTEEHNDEKNTNLFANNHFDEASPISMLDACILNKIFSYLPIKQVIKIERVCKKWRYAAIFTWSKIKKLDYSKEESYYSSHYFLEIEQMIIRCGKYLTDLRLGNVNTTILDLIKKKCSGITNLELTFQKNILTQLEWYMVISNMIELEFLSVKLDKLITQVPLYLSVLLEEKTSSLLGFTIIGSPSSHDNYDSYPSFSAEDPLPRFKCLRSLTYRNMIFKSIDLKTVVQHPNLISLEVSDCYSENLSSIDPILKLKNLEFLFISIKNVEFRDHQVVSVAQNCPTLKILKLYNCCHLTDMSIGQVAKMENLEELVLRRETDFCSTGLNECFATTNDSLEQFRNLRRLEIPGTKIDQKGIMKLLVSSPNLKDLKLNGSLVDMETVALIADITRERTNNIVLNLCLLDLEITPGWKESPKYQSPYLKVSVTN